MTEIHIHTMKDPQKRRILILAILVISITQVSNAREHESDHLLGEDGLTTTPPFDHLVKTTQKSEGDSLTGNFTTNNFRNNTSFVNNRSRGKASKRFQMVGYVLVPTFIITGLFGNTLTITMMRQSLFRTTAVSTVLIMLSLSDSTLLLILPFNKLFVRKYLGLDVRALHWIGCKIFFWFWRTAKMTSSWFMVLLSLERLIVQLYPLKTKVTSRTASYSVFLVCTLSGAYNIGLAHFGDVIKNGICVQGVANNVEHDTIVRNLLLGTLCLYTFIPMTVTLFVTIVSLFMLKRRARERTTSKSECDPAGEVVITDKLSSMIYGIIITFSILIFPVAILQVLPAASRPGMASPSPVAVFRVVAEAMEELNYSINFYIYVVCNWFFRDQLFTLFGCGCYSDDISNKMIISRVEDVPKRWKAVRRKTLEGVKKDPEEGTSTKHDPAIPEVLTVEEN